MTNLFTYNVNKNCIECDGKFVAYLNSIDGFRIANKLSVLTEENEQLKQTNQKLYDKLQEEVSYVSLKMGEVSILERENEQLKEQVKQLQHWNKCLAEKRHQELKGDVE